MPTADRPGLAPPRRQHPERAERDRRGGRRPQHRRAPAAPPSRPPPQSAASSSSLMPPSGPTTSITAVGRARARRRSAVASPTRAGPAPPRPAAAVAPTAATSSAVRHQRTSPPGRTDAATGGPPSAPPPRQRRSPFSTLAGPSQRATQRSDCHATNASAPASVASSIASSERSDFGSACTTVTGGLARRRRCGGRSTRAVEPALRRVLDDAVRDRARAVAEVEFLTGPDPSHVGGVEALVAVDDGELADLGQRVDVEQRATHAAHRSATGEGLAQPAEQAAARGRRVRRLHLGDVPDAVLLELAQQLGVLRGRAATAPRPRCGRAGCRARRSAGAACRAHAATRPIPAGCPPRW